MPALLGLLLSRPNGQQNARWAQLRCLQEEGEDGPAPGRSLPVPRRGPTLSGRINLFPLPRSSRGGSYFL